MLVGVHAQLLVFCIGLVIEHVFGATCWHISKVERLDYLLVISIIAGIVVCTAAVLCLHLLLVLQNN